MKYSTLLGFNLILILHINNAHADIPALQYILSFFGVGSNRTLTPLELGQSRGQCYYDFINYIEHTDRVVCNKDDNFIDHLLPIAPSVSLRKPPIRVRCMQLEPATNGTDHQNTLLMMKSVNDIVTLLKPIGNGTKRHELGSCVLVLFYTWSSLGCAHIAPAANMLPHLFPTIRIAAVDAFALPNFNTEFGIVGLPTLLLFHQGRPVVKFYSDLNTFAAFVTRHTGIKPVVPLIAESEVKGPLPLQPTEEHDYVLILAWLFILVCLGNYFAKSNFAKQIVEMCKRNWRESEAQLET